MRKQLAKLIEQEGEEMGMADGKTKRSPQKTQQLKHQRYELEEKIQMKEEELNGYMAL